MDAAEEARRKKFMEDLNAEYAELKKDPEAWADFQAELKLWDVTLMDGLDKKMKSGIQRLGPLISDQPNDSSSKLRQGD